jgi:hypothetical protein
LPRAQQQYFNVVCFAFRAVVPGAVVVAAIVIVVTVGLIVFFVV